MVVEEIKKLVLDDHVLAVPDEFAAITAANCWLQGEATGGRPYEMAADTSGYAIGGIICQCTKDGKLRVLGYYSAHLSPCQQRYQLFEQELLGLLYTRRDMIKQRSNPGDHTHGPRQHRASGRLTLGESGA